MFLAIADKRYTQKLAFVFLSEVSTAFDEELKNTYGSTSNIDYSSKIETIDNHYAFLKFGKFSVRLNPPKILIHTFYLQILNQFASNFMFPN